MDDVDYMLESISLTAQALLPVHCVQALMGVTDKGRGSDRLCEDSGSSSLTHAIDGATIHENRHRIALIAPGSIRWAVAINKGGRLPLAGRTDDRPARSCSRQS